ncbi:DUF4336 domain-containing protein [Parvularcula flava]|uniref:DUF4336 domain-containing protein n=1 Tax=Aquisalinus luteolus TaxID=1566827 RepID=A0A8J3A4X5_9PROT|nr:DUF4336 domain-containing protein [Aquisalinus luteolus]NHK26677.1 DUF4336 domain-containing protein [Aquisalinus luteolus]GGH93069.1 hypothetical protein GCM10011355_04040 [Aquisalinus luteolus]
MQQFADSLWLADGGTVEVFGFAYPTRMAVIRLADGGVFIWSPIELTDALREQVEALGPVRYIVAPNTLHHLYLGDWKAAFPDAELIGAPGLPEKRDDLTFDDILSDQPNAGWAGEIDQCPIMGNKITTEVVFFHRSSGTVLFTDLLQQYPKGWFSGWRALVAKLDLMMEPEPSVPRKFRLAFTDKPAAHASLEKVLNWPAEKIVMAHGTPVVQDARGYLRRAFAWLF